MTGLFFFHLPKAGGTSLRIALEERFSPEERASLIENDTVDHLRNGGNFHFARGYRFYAGHFGVDVFEAVRAQHRPLTNFRHPIARIASLYRYFRSVSIPEPDLAHPRFFAVRFARRHDFAAFVRSDDPRVQVYTTNQHARQLTRSPWRLSGEIDLGKAVALIDAMPCFYVCEEAQRSLAWFREELGLATIPRVNVTPGPAAAALSNLDDEILAINQLDLALYEHALARLRALPGAGAISTERAAA